MADGMQAYGCGHARRTRLAHNGIISSIEAAERLLSKGNGDMDAGVIGLFGLMGLTVLFILMALLIIAMEGYAMEVKPSNDDTTVTLKPVPYVHVERVDTNTIETVSVEGIAQRWQRQADEG
jgi:hypothetical protein